MFIKMDEKFSTKDYPQTRDYPHSRDIPAAESRGKFYSVPAMTVAEETPKKQNAFIRFLKFVFVKDIGIKLASIFTAGAVFLLGAGLGAVI
jgi:hypothetical protein